MSEYLEIKKIIVEPSGEDDPDRVKITETSCSANSEYTSFYYGSREELKKRELIPLATPVTAYKYIIENLGLEDKIGEVGITKAPSEEEIIKASKSLNTLLENTLRDICYTYDSLGSISLSDLKIYRAAHKIAELLGADSIWSQQFKMRKELIKE